MNKHVCLSILLSISGSVAFAQKNLTIKVVDAATNQPLQGATVTNLQNDLHRVTNANGSFSLPESSDSVSVSFVGYDSKTTTVNQQKNIISLSPSFANLNEVVVSGNNELQKRTQFPVAIDVISKTQINDTKASRLDMLVNKVPGVSLSIWETNNTACLCGSLWATTIFSCISKTESR